MMEMWKHGENAFIVRETDSVRVFSKIQDLKEYVKRRDLL